jgi:hypothetical protein
MLVGIQTRRNMMRTATRTTRGSLAVVAAGMATAICLHVLVAVVLITGLARFMPRPWQAAEYGSSRG